MLARANYCTWELHSDRKCLMYAINSKSTLPDTVKPEILACHFFHEFCDLSKFAEITGRKYLNANGEYLNVKIVQQAKMPN